MKKSTTTIVLRSLQGLIFLVFGLNGFLHFLPMPPLPADAGEFMGAMAKTGYMLSLISGSQVVAGAMLLLGLYVPLALVILAPVIVNIIGFHIFLAPSGLPLAIVVALLEAILAWRYREAFYPLLGIGQAGARNASGADVRAGVRA